jgi:hypothetical protein
MLQRYASYGRVGDDLHYDDFLDGHVCDVCPERTPPDPLATIAADLAALTARVSDVETTTSPTAAAALSEARRHLLRASAAVERAQEAKAGAEIAGDMAAQAEPEAADIPAITPEMVEATNVEIAKRRAGRQGSPLAEVADAPCPECGAKAVSFVDDLVFDEMVVGEQGVTPIRIPNLTGIRCSNCGDHAFDADSSKKIMEAVQGAGA